MVSQSAASPTTGTDELEIVWDARQRWRIMQLCFGGVLIFLALTVASALPWTGSGEQVADIGFGAAMASLSAALGLLHLAPQQTGSVGEPSLSRGQVCLPLRTWREGAWALVCCSYLTFAVCAVAGPDESRKDGIGLIFGLGLVFWYLPKRWTTDRRLRLDPKGFAITAWLQETYVHWADVKGVEPHPERASLLVRLRRGREAEISAYRHRWTPSALGAVITYYAEKPSARAELTDVRALDKFGADHRPDPDGDGDDDHRRVDRTHGPQH